MQSLRAIFIACIQFLGTKFSFTAYTTLAGLLTSTTYTGYGIELLNLVKIYIDNI